MKQNYPGAPTMILENPKNSDVMVDFLVGPPDASFVEYNVFLYAKRPAGGIIAYQYALRTYDDVPEFVKNLTATRERLRNEMADTGLQAK